MIHSLGRREHRGWSPVGGKRRDFGGHKMGDFLATLCDQ